MKALIFNSGTGSRMGILTQNRPKCLLEINGETVLHRQLRLLSECGIHDVIITTGKYDSDIRNEAEKIPDIHSEFVFNPEFSSTNYIFSFYLCKEYLNDDIIMMHGDLVFEKSVLKKLMKETTGSYCLVDPSAEKPDKDFKGRVENGILREVSVNIFDENCYAFQPLYRLSEKCILQWVSETEKYIQTGRTNVYAENALNDIADRLNIRTFSYAGCFINEIDNAEDYKKVMENIKTDENLYYGISSLEILLGKYEASRVFLVMGNHLKGSEFEKYIDSLDITVSKFSGVIENPTDESVAEAVKVFESDEFDVIISAGGGSVIDTAKAVKHFTGNRNIIHIAVPTTAGSGSEATQYSVLCRNNTKYSLSEPELLPDAAILDSSLLEGMNRQQKAVSLLDALCHSIESMMTPGVTSESRKYAEMAIKIIYSNYEAYLNDDLTVNQDILLASYYSGKAISFTRTSVGHAMSYSLTTGYGIRHGQAVALSLIFALKYAEKNGRRDEFSELYGIMEEYEGETLYEKLLNVYERINPEHSYDLSSASEESLGEKVNESKLGNCVYKFDSDTVRCIYSDILKYNL
ncbi:MAG: iron-containing alcohol dehydrogenase [Oscillospiraceae bacterium]|nr:iron-containing alcohol dehydrogenase [Oscillospiraceae bacterium]